MRISTQVLFPAILIGASAPTPAWLGRAPLSAYPSPDSCPPDTTGRSELERVGLGLAPGENAASVEGAESEYLLAAEALRAHFTPPASVSLPLWARFLAPEDSVPRELTDALGYGLASGVSFRLRADGRLADSSVFVDTASPELNESLRMAVRRADSAQALPKPGYGIRHDRGRIILQLIDWDERRGPAAGLVRLVIPVIRIDSGVAVRRIPGPAYPSSLRQREISGAVELQYVVTEAGRIDPASFKVIRGQYREFVKAAIEAIRRGTFKPARLRGCPVPMLVQQRIFFRIGG
jgi:TonB family protein